MNRMHFFSVLFLVLLLSVASASPGRRMLAWPWDSWEQPKQQQGKAQGSCWDANGAVWIPHGSGVKCQSGTGQRTCHWGSWHDKCFTPQPPPLPPPATSSCKNPATGNWVEHTMSIPCPSGSGTRKCNFGRWEDNCSSGCKNPDTGNMIPEGSSITCKSGYGKRTCTNGNWVDNCDCRDSDGGIITNGWTRECLYGLSGSRVCRNGVLEGACIAKGVPPGKPKSGQCWDATRNQMVASGDTFSCTKGGTRMCDNGSWRVLNGQCTGQDIVDEKGRESTIVTSSYTGGR